MQRQKYSKSTNISALMLLQNKGELVIPAVQRELVWTKSQNQLLIDSLFKDFDIPKIYFRDVETAGKRVYEVIDGQQRLNAIFSFITDGYELPMDADDVDGEKVAGKKWSELSSMLQIQFSTNLLMLSISLAIPTRKLTKPFCACRMVRL
jgi:hypothetical protein